MIFDLLEELPRYSGSVPGVDRVTRFIAECTAAPPEPGRYELDGARLYVNIQHYRPRAFNPDKLEYHHDFIDIQLLLSGREFIYYAPLAGLEESAGFVPENDCGFRRVPTPDAALRLDMRPGNFAVFFPGEGHMPCVGNPDAEVIKAVFKIAVG